ncbi:Ferredoxin-1 (plasmid) [Caballeronia sp. SBC1]|uniref:ferredoxin family protein n=1 Tax=unclassified Caballeronia TaxID=2646786 RepID=UPI0013E17D31|nr:MULTISPECIES: ferredoxin family protein [unclassified Caballeronia]QIE27198.1 Ferredoxin-1 [Caballeronia sp. SBC2]QIN65323.1 Ferredoxin-1 [Caballeronia sp. SBC1]
MTAVVTENCNACRFTECVNVCPVACFHGDGEMLYIDGAVCIDCTACLVACPVQAIYMSSDMPSELEKWIDINAERSAVLPLVTQKADPLPTAEERRATLGF